MNINAYGAHARRPPLEPIKITRRAPGAHDVQIDIAYLRRMPLRHPPGALRVGGHALSLCAGARNRGPRVAAVARTCSGFKLATWSASAASSTAASTAQDCDEGLENYCDHMVGTYNGPTPDAPGHTLGGYSQQIVVHERYVLRIRHPEAQLAAVAPLLCAGITTYSPLRHWKVGPGQKVGVVGIGGLGHMGIKLAHAMGAHVVAFTTSESKRKAAMALGADEVVVSRNADEMAAHAKSLDFILNTVAAPHDLDAFLDPAQARRHDGAGGRAGHAAPFAAECSASS